MARAPGRREECHAGLGGELDCGRHSPAEPDGGRLNRALFRGSFLSIDEVCCSAPRSSYGSEELCSATELIIPMRGLFLLSRGGEPVVADCGSVLVFREGDVQRVSHPADGGDDCAVLAFSRPVLDDALPDRYAQQAPLRPAGALGVRVLTSALRRGLDTAGREQAIREPRFDPDEIEVEDAALALLGVLAADLCGQAATVATATPWAKARVAEARALLGSDPAKRWSLPQIGRALGCSPYHLARQFRAVSGYSLHGYLVRLRLGLALARLAGGETDLSRLAADTGFSSHSHFSAQFSRAFGAPPADIRERLTGSGERELRTFLTAPPPRTV